MYDDVAGLRFTLEADGFDRFEIACGHDEPSVRQLLLDKDGIETAFVLKTCQRYELYAQGPRARTELASFGRTIGVDVSADDRLLAGESVAEHLFRVACGLESGVLGEDEILGQLRGAYKRASEAGALEGTLDTIVLKALRVGERTRTETAINEGTVSLGSVTIDRARDEVSDLADCDVLVIGAGEVAELVVKALAHRTDVDESVTVANRTYERAERLAAEVDGDALPLESLDNGHLTAADILVTATGADDRVLSISDLVGHELVVFDLANPRDVDPAAGDLDDVELVSIDEVLAVRNEGLERREAAIPDAEAIVDEEIERLDEQLRAERVDDSLSEIYSHAHGIREAEFDRALRRLESEAEALSETQEDAMRDFSEALINKLLHPKTQALRQAAARDDHETVDAWLRLFEQEGDGLTLSDGESKNDGPREEATVDDRDPDSTVEDHNPDSTVD